MPRSKLVKDLLGNLVGLFLHHLVNDLCLLLLELLQLHVIPPDLPVVPPGEDLPQPPDQPGEHQEGDDQQQLLLPGHSGREQLEVNQHGQEEVDDNAVGDQVPHHLLLPYHCAGLELADAGYLCLQLFQHLIGGFLLPEF